MFCFPVRRCAQQGRFKINEFFSPLKASGSTQAAAVPPRPKSKTRQPKPEPQPTTTLSSPAAAEEGRPAEAGESSRPAASFACRHEQPAAPPTSASGNTWCGCSSINPPYFFIGGGRTHTVSTSSATPMAAVGQQPRFHFIPNPSLRPAPLAHTSAFSYTPPPPFSSYPAPMPTFPPPPVFNFRLPSASVHTHGGARSPVWWSYPSMAAEPVATASAHHGSDATGPVSPATRVSAGESPSSSSAASGNGGTGNAASAPQGQTSSSLSYGVYAPASSSSTTSGAARPVDGRSTMPAAIARSFMRMHPLHHRIWSAQQRSQVVVVS